MADNHSCPKGMGADVTGYSSEVKGLQRFPIISESSPQSYVVPSLSWFIELTFPLQLTFWESTRLKAFQNYLLLR